MRRAVLLIACLLQLEARGLQFTDISPKGPPGSGNVQSLSVSHSGTLHAAIGRTIYRSSDLGATWSRTGVYSYDPYMVEFDPADDDTIYAGASLSSIGFVSKSADGGATWRTVASGFYYPTAIRLDEQDQAAVYVSGTCSPAYVVPGAILKSVDRGETFSKIYAASGRVSCVESLTLDAITSPSTLYYSTLVSRPTDIPTQPTGEVVADPADPVHRYSLSAVSADSGRTWTSIQPNGRGASRHLLFDARYGRMLASGYDALYRSDDRGQTWSTVAGLPKGVNTAVVAGDFAFVATMRGLYRAPRATLDAWTLVPLGGEPPPSPQVRTFAVDPNDSATLYASVYETTIAGQVGQIVRSRDGGRHWDRITDDYDTEVRSNMVVDAASDLYVVRQSGIERFARVTQQWESSSASFTPYETNALLADPRLPGWLYSAGFGPPSVSVDSGRTWQLLGTPPSATALSIAPNGSTLATAGTDGIWLSDDRGTTWRKVASLDTEGIAIAPSRPATIYAYHATNPAYIFYTLYRSDDGGATWARTNDVPLALSCCLTLVVDPLDERSVWLGGMHSTDGGVTFRDESNAQLDASSAQVVIGGDGRTLYASDAAGLHQATLRGEHRRAAPH